MRPSRQGAAEERPVAAARLRRVSDIPGAHDVGAGPSRFGAATGSVSDRGTLPKGADLPPEGRPVGAEPGRSPPGETGRA